MTKLHVSNNLSLPIDAATQTFAFIARKGAGKTYAAGKLAECLLDASVQVVVLDSVGNWWGLRLDADGKSAGYDIPVVGGLRGDIPLEATGGQLIADILTDSGRSMILDVSQFSKADRQRFATAFAEELWKRKKAEKHPSPIHLIIEESQLIVPESVRGDVAKMVGIYEEIIRLGRNYGIGVSMISQRPQSVNKEVLNQTECLFVLQVNGAHERKALKEWIVYHGADRSLIDALPSLPIGTAYVWSPQWLQILKKIEIGKKKTFDASATPKVGSAQVRRDLKPLDLDDLKDRMAATIERAKADDPKELRRQIADLKRRAEKPTTVSVETIKEVEVPAIDKDTVSRFLASVATLREAVTVIGEKADQITASLATVGTNGHKSPPQRAAPQARPAPAISRKSRVEPSGTLPIGESKILAALIQYPNGLERTQLTVLTGYKRSTRDAYIQRLSEKGYVNVYGPKILATKEGIDALPDYEPLPTGIALQNYWLNKLPKGEADILRVLIDSYPNAIDRESVSESTGYKRSTRDAYLQRLGAKELVDAGRGDVTANENLFD